MCEHVCAGGRGEEGRGGESRREGGREKRSVLKRNWVGS